VLFGHRRDVSGYANACVSSMTGWAIPAVYLA
jgi:hypothetical protein